MSTDQANCPYCNTVNTYSDSHCKQCREQLPWAAWNAAKGDRPKTRYDQKYGGQAVKEGGSILGGLDTKMVIMVLMIFVTLGVVAFALHHATPAINELTDHGRNTGNVVSTFKNANPAVGETSNEKKQEGN